MEENQERRKIPENWKRVTEGEWWDYWCEEGAFRTIGYTEEMLLRYLKGEEMRIEHDYEIRKAFIRNVTLRIKEGIQNKDASH